MVDLDKILTKFVKRFETVGRHLEVGLVLQHLMILQLDGRLEVSNNTMRLYIEAMAGSTKEIKAFRKHVVETYYS
ncbi:hypothetical protein ES703_02626 [subsurface metagenome]